MQDRFDASARSKAPAAADRTGMKEERPGGGPGAPDALDDVQRIKVLSPGMMVLKRFLRNRLAITGLVILVVMFAFSFIGGLLSPYRQDQTFYTTGQMDKEYASATRNTELRYAVAEGESFSKAAYASLILSVNRGDPAFAADGKQYTYTVEGDRFYSIHEMNVLSDVATRKGLYAYDNAPGFTLSEGLRGAFEEAHKAGASVFEHEGLQYHIVQDGKTVHLSRIRDVALASMLVFTPYQPEDAALVNGYAFRLAAQRAVVRGDAGFDLDGTAYAVDAEGADVRVSRAADGAPVASVSDIIVNALSPDVFLTVGFKSAAIGAIRDGEKSFTFPDAAGGEVLYNIVLVNSIYNIKTQTRIQLIDMYSAPGSDHALGTDQNGMDMLTRLMYGGRISLMVGFVVVFLEMFIGIIVGGVAGYFGGWLDTLLMRFVDLFNCIPYYPIMIIMGSVMDTMQVDPYVRIFLLMFIMGLMGWTGIARVVRGQILALREQDFMIATEAAGLRVSRRISRHLVPNVMPLLIVQATMSLGGIILTEATLSFLGLGVKYPLASWGSIINAASNPYIVTNYWFIWVPAGTLILLTVLGFNFVGDGLRDAFDPRMKR